MRVSLTADELSGIADRLTQRLESTVKAAVRKSGDQSREALSLSPTSVRDLARDLTPIVCPEDALLTADQARALMGIKKSKWYMLRSEGKIPDPVPTICGDRWHRSTILRSMAHAEVGGES